MSQDFDAPANPSCGTAMDLDNDERLDIVLLDELADLVILMHNDARTGDTDGDAAVGILDFLDLLGSWGLWPDPCPPFCPADLNGDCQVSITDMLLLLANWD